MKKGFVLGKCKQRQMAQARHQKFELHMTRKEALEAVQKEFETNPASTNARNIISLFGLTAEELSEVGVTYEILRSMDGLI